MSRIGKSLETKSTLAVAEWESVPYNQNFGFSSSHVRMWELYNKEDWVPKKWCYQILVLETLEFIWLQGDPISQS